MPRRKTKKATPDQIAALKEIAQNLRDAGIDELSLSVAESVISIKKKSKWKTTREGLVEIAKFVNFLRK
jgi:hypothetical protein